MGTLKELFDNTFHLINHDKSEKLIVTPGGCEHIRYSPTTYPDVRDISMEEAVEIAKRMEVD